MTQTGPWRAAARLRSSARHILGSAFTGVLAASLVLASAPSVTAATHDYGWGDCNWQWKDSATSTQITWKYDGAYPFPANGSKDGVVNSFTDRVSNTMSRWNSALGGFGAIARLAQVASNAGANIVLSYQDPFGTEFGATTITTIATNTCVLHSTTDMQMRAAHVYITPKSNWFTQDDSRRSYWETNCPAGECDGSALPCRAEKRSRPCNCLGAPS